MTKIVCLSAGALCAASIALPARAATDGRDYEGLVDAPANSVAGIGYFRHQATANTQNNATDLAVFRAVYVAKLGGLTITPIDVSLPLLDVTAYIPSGSGGAVSAEHAAGFGDVTYVLSLAGAIPGGGRDHTYLGLSPIVTAPTGSYDSSQSLNVGSHRWSYGLQAAIGQRLFERLTLEAVGNATTSSANSEFLGPSSTGARLGTYRQAPTWGAEAHATVDLSPQFYVGASYYLTAFGHGSFEVDVDDAMQQTTFPMQTVQSVRITTGILIEKTTLLLLQFDRDVSASSGASMASFYGARLSHLVF